MRNAAVVNAFVSRKFCHSGLFHYALARKIGFKGTGLDGDVSHIKKGVDCRL